MKSKTIFCVVVIFGILKLATAYPSDIDTTTFPTTIPFDPCSSCRDAPVQFTDIWAGQCVPRGDGIDCRCECISIFCRENEIIDTITCRSDGSIADCRCILIETTTFETSFPSEPTTFPPTEPYDPCSSCRDAPVQFTDIWAGQCVPRGDGTNCRCECLSIFCRTNEIIDTTTCRSDGSISDCRCIPIETTTSETSFPSEPTTFPTTDPYDPCSSCRDSPVQFTDTWAGQCFPSGEGASCQCACGSIFCGENEIIDRTTCRADGTLADCRCIPTETTITPPTPPSTFPPTTFPPTSFPPTTFPPTTFPPTTFPPTTFPPTTFPPTTFPPTTFPPTTFPPTTFTPTTFPPTTFPPTTFPPTTFPPTTFPPTTVPDDPCEWCRDAPVQFTDSWAGQCFPLGDDVSCQCACGSIFCRDNEMIDTTTCRSDGSLADCRCILRETTTATANYN